VNILNKSPLLDNDKKILEEGIVHFKEAGFYDANSIFFSNYSVQSFKIIDFLFAHSSSGLV